MRKENLKRKINLIFTIIMLSFLISNSINIKNFSLGADATNIKFDNPSNHTFVAENVEQRKQYQISAPDTNIGAKYSLADTIPENTEVKDQGNAGWCSTFAGCAGVETSLALSDKKAGKPATKYDFSEKHMAYSNARNSFLNNAVNEYGMIDKVTENVGYYVSSMQNYYTNGMGMVNESDMPYTTDGNDIDIKDLNKKISATVKDTVEIDGLNEAGINSTSDFSTDKMKTTIDNMKLFIKNYGGIVATLYSDESKYMSVEYYSYNDPNHINPNHAITIIGWDDNYSKDKFVDGYKPKNDGAWIVKNSHGTTTRIGTVDNVKQILYENTKKAHPDKTLQLSDITEDAIKSSFKEVNSDLNVRIEDGYVYLDRTGETKYMHISYETPSIYCYLLGVQDAVSGKDYTNLYEYDKLGATGYLGVESTQVYLSSDFTRKDTNKYEKLTRVGITVPVKQKYTIYANTIGTTKNSNSLAKISDTVTLDPGYHTFDIDTEPYLSEKDFSIVVKVEPADNSGQIFIPVSRVTDTAGKYVTVEQGKTFISNGLDGEWEDTYNQVQLSQDSSSDAGQIVSFNNCIKAYTTETGTAPTPVEPDPEPTKENKTTNTTIPERTNTVKPANTTNPERENTVKPANTTNPEKTNAVKPTNTTNENTTRPNTNRTNTNRTTIDGSDIPNPAVPQENISDWDVKITWQRSKDTTMIRFIITSNKDVEIDSTMGDWTDTSPGGDYNQGKRYYEKAWIVPVGTTTFKVRVYTPGGKIIKNGDTDKDYRYTVTGTTKWQGKTWKQANEEGSNINIDNRANSNGTLQTITVTSEDYISKIYYIWDLKDENAFNTFDLITDGKKSDNSEQIDESKIFKREFGQNQTKNARFDIQVPKGDHKLTIKAVTQDGSTLSKVIETHTTTDYNGEKNYFEENNINPDLPNNNNNNGNNNSGYNGGNSSGNSGNNSGRNANNSGSSSNNRSFIVSNNTANSSNLGKADGKIPQTGFESKAPAIILVSAIVGIIAFIRMKKLS